MWKTELEIDGVHIKFDTVEESMLFLEWWHDLSREDQFKDEMLAGEPPRKKNEF